METEEKAKEILDYCMEYLGTYKSLKEMKKTELYKQMAKQIEFMIDTD